MPRFFRCIAVLAVASVLPFFSSEAQQPPPDAQVQHPSDANDAAHSSTIDILYTGKLMGHFRAPDLQGPGKDGEGCGKPIGDMPASVAAQDFESLLETQFRADRVHDAILVGTGDNFAPELEAREFCAPPNHNDNTGQSVEVLTVRVGKEQFSWDDKASTPHWVSDIDVYNDWKQERENEKEGTKPDPNSFVQRLERGEGTIPFDNVANFFVQEGYAALVPGKHDFYFGAERLRELARYLNSREIPNTASNTLHEKYVRVLGANLVNETTWKKDHKPLPDTDSPPWFIPRFPRPQDLSTDTNSLTNPNLLKLTGLSDGASVYPWFQGPTIEISGDGGGSDSTTKDGEIDAVKSEFSKIKGNFYLCPTGEPGDPNDLVYPDPTKQNCARPLLLDETTGNKGTKFKVRFGGGQAQLLIPGRNYGLCVDAASSPYTDNHKETRGSENKSHMFCVRFSVSKPFFDYRAEDVAAGSLFLEKRDEKLEPFVLVRKTGDDGVKNDVAIFGVVDPNLASYIGLLNLAWENATNDKYKTTTSVKEPAEALQELLDYFDARLPALCPDCRPQPENEDGGIPVKRRLLKVLLAQMSPQVAQRLAAKVPGFQVVVSAADPDLATVNDPTTTEWNTRPDSPRRYPVTLAVPEPYYVQDRQPSPWIADIGRVTLRLKADPHAKWDIFSEHLELTSRDINYQTRRTIGQPVGFWDAVSHYLNAHCVKPTSKAPFNAPFAPAAGLGTDKPVSTAQRDQIEKLTACVMQQKFGADVVLLQKRDFFFDLPYAAPNSPPFTSSSGDFQRFLNRLIWKGDFLTFMYVPGATLQSVLKQSVAFDADDSSKISLSDEKGRGLVPLGARLVAGQYFVDEVPLDTTRLYAVATTDFIGAGDTGYPDLATAPLRPLDGPGDFDKTLYAISGLTCDRIRQYSPAASAECLGSFKRDAYFDDLADAPSNTLRVDSTAHDFWNWSIFTHKKTPPGTPKGSGKKSNPSSTDRFEQATEQRGLAARRINPPDGTLFALNEAALNFDMVNHKLSDAGVAQAFAGNPTPQLAAKRSHTLGYDIVPKVGYSWHRFQVFENNEERYNIQYTGNANAARTINQKENLLTSDTGGAFDLDDRSLPHFEAIGYFHYETQVEHPTIGTLAPLPKSDVIASPIDLSRTHYLLPRLGLRFVNQTSWIEAGLEDGGELKAVRLLPVASAPPNTTEFQIVRANIRVSGAYWRWHLVVPFSQRISWTIDENGDFFFNHHEDRQTDTRFLSDTKTSVNFKVFPSLSFAPTYEFFYYSNKAQNLNKALDLPAAPENWYWQGQASIQMKFQFDFWNHRHWGDEVKYKIPAAASN